MGASNRLQDLDPALLRPGRFDRQILIHPPDLKGRQDILDGAHARQAARRRTSTSRRSHATPPGLTGADLANICNEAAISAGRTERRCDHPAPTSSTPWTASSPGCSSGA